MSAEKKFYYVSGKSLIFNLLAVEFTHEAWLGYEAVKADK